MSLNYHLKFHEGANWLFYGGNVDFEIRSQGGIFVDYLRITDVKPSDGVQIGSPNYC